MVNENKPLRLGAVPDVATAIDCQVFNAAKIKPRHTSVTARVIPVECMYRSTSLTRDKRESSQGGSQEWLFIVTRLVFTWPGFRPTPE